MNKWKEKILGQGKDKKVNIWIFFLLNVPLRPFSEPAIIQKLGRVPVAFIHFIYACFFAYPRRLGPRCQI
jgi:hypothetical protein